MKKKTADSKKQIKFIIFIASGLLALLLFLDVFSLQANIFGLKKKETISVDRLAKLVVYFPDGKTKTFSGEVFKDMTILDALAAASQKGELQVDYLLDGGRLNFKSVDGIKYNKAKPWKFYLNGRLVGAEEISNTSISSRDVIEVKLNVTK